MTSDTRDGLHPDELPPQAREQLTRGDIQRAKAPRGADFLAPAGLGCPEDGSVSFTPVRVAGRDLRLCHACDRIYEVERT